jgi:P27 family predicted phage terminase small subunit
MARPRLSDAHHKMMGTEYKFKGKTASKLAGGRPRMPQHLTAEARKEWRRVLPLLEERKSVTEADAGALALYCEQFARWVAAKKSVDEKGITVTVNVLDRNGEQMQTTKVNPALRVLQEVEKALRQSLRELGLTPATRERVLPATPQEKQEKSIFDYLDEQ